LLWKNRFKQFQTVSNCPFWPETTISYRQVNAAFYSNLIFLNIKIFLKQRQRIFIKSASTIFLAVRFCRTKCSWSLSDKNNSAIKLCKAVLFIKRKAENTSVNSNRFAMGQHQTWLAYVSVFSPCAGILVICVKFGATRSEMWTGRCRVVALYRAKAAYSYRTFPPTSC